MAGERLEQTLPEALIGTRTFGSPCDDLLALDHQPIAVERDLLDRPRGVENPPRCACITSRSEVGFRSRWRCRCDIFLSQTVRRRPWLSSQYRPPAICRASSAFCVAPR